MHPRTAFGLVVSLGGLVLIAMIGGCGSGDGGGTGVRTDGSSPWVVQSADLPRTLRVGTGVDYCSGAPKPRIGPPRIEYQGDDVLITLTVIQPPEEPATPGEVCAGMELFVGRNITLKRDLEDVEVFDGGVDPPLQRWPN